MVGWPLQPVGGKISLVVAGRWMPGTWRPHLHPLTATAVELATVGRARWAGAHVRGAAGSVDPLAVAVAVVVVLLGPVGARLAEVAEGDDADGYDQHDHDEDHRHGHQGVRHGEAGAALAAGVTPSAAESRLSAVFNYRRDRRVAWGGQF